MNVRLDASCTKVRAWNTNGTPVDISANAVQTENGFTYIDLPDIGAWNALLLIGE